MPADKFGCKRGVEVSSSRTAMGELLDLISNMIHARWRVVAAVVFLLEQLCDVAPPSGIAPGCTVLGGVTSSLVIGPSQRFCKVHSIL